MKTLHRDAQCLVIKNFMRSNSSSPKDFSITKQNGSNQINNIYVYCQPGVTLLLKGQMIKEKCRSVNMKRLTCI